MQRLRCVRVCGGRRPDRAHQRRGPGTNAWPDPGRLWQSPWRAAPLVWRSATTTFGTSMPGAGAVHPSRILQTATLNPSSVSTNGTSALSVQLGSAIRHGAGRRLTSRPDVCLALVKDVLCGLGRTHGFIRAGHHFATVICDGDHHPEMTDFPIRLGRRDFERSHIANIGSHRSGTIYTTKKRDLFRYSYLAFAGPGRTAWNGISSDPLPPWSRRRP